MGANLGQLTLDLVARIGSFTGPIDKAARQAQKSMQSIQQSAGSASTAISGLSLAAGGVSVAGVVALAAEMSQSAMEMERMERQFKVSTGSALLAGDSLKFVRDEADALGLGVKDLTGSYARFMTSVKGTANEGQKGRDAFIGISEGIAAVGMSAEEQAHAWIQLTQGIMKGKFEMQDLKAIQEAGLPIIKLMAQALGITSEELLDMQSKGKLLVEDVLPKLGESMHKEFGQAAKSASESAQGSMARFKNEVFLASAALGEELLPTIGKVADATAKFLKEEREGKKEFSITKAFSQDAEFMSRDMLRIKMIYGDYKAILGEMAQYTPLAMGGGKDKEFWKGVAAQGKQMHDEAARQLMMGVSSPTVPVSNIDPQMSRALADKKADQENTAIKNKAAAELARKNKEAADLAEKEAKAAAAAEKSRLKSIADELKAFQLKAASIGLDQEGNEVEKLRAKGATAAQIRQAEAAQKLIDDYQEQLAIAKEMEELQKAGAEFALEKSEKQTEEAKKLAAFAASQAQILADTQSGLDISIFGAGSSDREKQRAQELLSIRQKFNEDVAALTEQYTGGDISKELYDQETQVLKDALDKRLQMQQNHYAKLDELRSDWVTGGKEAIANYMEELKDYSSIANKFVSNQFANMEDAIVGFVTTGKASFSDFANSVIKDLARIAVQQTIMGPLAELGKMGLSALGSAFGGGNTSIPAQNGYKPMDMKSAAGGYDIPAGINPVVQTHAKEMILPAEYAEVIRGMAKEPAAAPSQTSISVPVTVEGNNKLSSALRDAIEETVLQVLRRHA